MRDSVSEKKATTKKGYESPRLEVLGDIRGLTLGGTPGIGDSGASFTLGPCNYSGGPGHPNCP